MIKQFTDKLENKRALYSVIFREQTKQTYNEWLWFWLGPV